MAEVIVSGTTMRDHVADLLKGQTLLSLLGYILKERVNHDVNFNFHLV